MVEQDVVALSCTSRTQYSCLQLMATQNRAAMANHLLEIVRGFESVENITNAMSNIDAQAAEIVAIATQLRPASALQETTDQITRASALLVHHVLFSS